MPTAWSPDGRLLAGPILGGPSSAIGVYDVTSRTARQISERRVHVPELVWLQDNKRLLVSIRPCYVVAGRCRERPPPVRGVRREARRRPDGVARSAHALRAVSRQQADLWMVETKAKR